MCQRRPASSVAAPLGECSQFEPLDDGSDAGADVGQPAVFDPRDFTSHATKRGKPSGLA